MSENNERENLGQDDLEQENPNKMNLENDILGEEIPTSEKYRQDAQLRIDKLKSEWKIFGRTGIIAAVAAIAIIAGSIAWFYINDKVGMSSTNIQASGSEYDIAAAGSDADSTKGKYDNLLDVPTGKQSTIGGESYITTDESNTSITWAITSESNMLNNTDMGIEPGSSGSMTFYIIPHKAGLLSVNLNLTITGYTGDEAAKSSQDLKKIDSATQQLLEGHLLLFAGYDESSNSYKGWISEDAAPWTMSLDSDVSLSRDEIGNVVWTAENVKAETAYPVTVYWIWPEVLESYLTKAGNYTGSRPILFPENSDADDTANPGALPKDLYKTMSSAKGDTSNRYFRWDDKAQFEENVKESLLTSMRISLNPVIYGNMSSYYNSADQYLGENVRYVNLKLETR